MCILSIAVATQQADCKIDDPSIVVHGYYKQKLEFNNGVHSLPNVEFRTGLTNVLMLELWLNVFHCVNSWAVG